KAKYSGAGAPSSPPRARSPMRAGNCSRMACRRCWCCRGRSSFPKRGPSLNLRLRPARYAPIGFAEEEGHMKYFLTVFVAVLAMFLLNSQTLETFNAEAQTIPTVSTSRGKVCTILRIHQWIAHVPVPDTWESQDCLELARGAATGYPGASHYKLSCMTAHRLL